MCKKWTDVEFQKKVKALEAKKRRKRVLKDGVEVLTSALISSPIAVGLCIIAEKVY